MGGGLQHVVWCYRMGRGLAAWRLRDTIGDLRAGRCPGVVITVHLWAWGERRGSITMDILEERERALLFDDSLLLLLLKSLSVPPLEFLFALPPGRDERRQEGFLSSVGLAVSCLDQSGLVLLGGCPELGNRTPLSVHPFSPHHALS